MHSVKEIEDYQNNQEETTYIAKQLELFLKTQNAFKLLDLTKTQNRTYTTFSKDKLRTYMKNPYNNASNLRNLSQFLYRMSYPYRRLIQYNAQMVDLTAMSVIPNYDINKEVKQDKVMKDYYNTLKKIRQIGLDKQILKMLIVAWREDTVYGYVYDDDNDFYIHILDGEYCKISSVQGGKLNFSFDFSYFRSHATDLEFGIANLLQKTMRTKMIQI